MSSFVCHKKKNLLRVGVRFNGGKKKALEYEYVLDIRKGKYLPLFPLDCLERLSFLRFSSQAKTTF